jgi:hypothetical protein
MIKVADGIEFPNGTTRGMPEEGNRRLAATRRIGHIGRVGEVICVDCIDEDRFAHIFGSKNLSSIARRRLLARLKMRLGVVRAQI